MKKSNANLIWLNIIFVVCLIVANVVTAKVINTGLIIGDVQILIPGAAFTYALTFLCTDIIGEIWGKEEANKTVWRGFFAQLLALTFIILTQYLPAYDETMQEAYNKLLGQTSVFVIGSLVAYLCSQKWDMWIFHKVRSKFMGRTDWRNWRWVWNNVGTISSQIIDTSIYAIIAFGLGMGWFWQDNGLVNVLSIILGQYLLKVCLAILDTPFFYYFTRKYQF